MIINKMIEGNTMTLVPEGRLDTLTAPELEKEIREMPEEITGLVFDLGGLDYISSAGLRVLLMAQKTMNKKGSMKVTNVNEIIAEIFEVTCFSDILTIE